MQNHKWKSIGSSIRLIWEMDRWLLIHSLAASVIEAALPFIAIILSGYVLDGLKEGERIERLLAVSLSAVLGIFVLTVLRDYFKKLKTVHTGRCGKRYETMMSMKTISMDYPLLDSPQVNELRARIQHDNDWGAGFYSLAWQLPWLLDNLISTFLSVALILPLFWKYHVFTNVFAVEFFVLFGLAVAFHVGFQAKKNRELFQLLDDPSLDKSYFSYYLWRGQDYHAGKDVRIYGTKALIEKKLEGDLLIKRAWMRKIVSNNMQAGFWNHFVAGFLQTLSYLFVVIQAAKGLLSMGAVVKYAGIIYRFSKSLADLFTALEEYSVSGNRQLSTLEYLNIEDVLARGKLPVEKRAFCEGGDNEYEIRFRDVSFRYPGSEEYALRHVNIRFHVGERLAVVGPNGSGKTTLIKLLCRLYDPDEGEILLNGINIKKYDYKEYMGIFSVVFQDFKLFSFCLGQNVAAGVDYDREKAGSCLEKAGFAVSTDKLPSGLDTYLYKDYEGDGVEISGGEAQKIALARALYKDAPFIILDEPTAALDPVAEYEIYSKFNEIVEDKTAIYISHRLSSCRFCDEIAVFDHGQIIQRGSHEQLVSDVNGKYYELWHAQAQYYVESAG